MEKGKCEWFSLSRTPPFFKGEKGAFSFEFEVCCRGAPTTPRGAWVLNRESFSI